ncbi:unnamed protein product [Angiostrongylus costaricensis]|uniref:GRIP domain-containing protein n=1 Tax=Angiostrongylus costaricensis TaxID=334426 RepID=A0A158PEN4_ANGCS|nr:unnamed protein product [Angiostrongylus costaricensis]
MVQLNKSLKDAELALEASKLEKEELIQQLSNHKLSNDRINADCLTLQSELQEVRNRLHEEQCRVRELTSTVDKLQDNSNTLLTARNEERVTFEAKIAHNEERLLYWQKISEQRSAELSNLLAENEMLRTRCHNLEDDFISYKSRARYVLEQQAKTAENGGTINGLNTEAVQQSLIQVMNDLEELQTVINDARKYREQCMRYESLNRSAKANTLELQHRVMQTNEELLNCKVMLELRVSECLKYRSQLSCMEEKLQELVKAKDEALREIEQQVANRSVVEAGLTSELEKEKNRYEEAMRRLSEAQKERVRASSASPICLHRSFVKKQNENHVVYHERSLESVLFGEDFMDPCCRLNINKTLSSVTEENEQLLKQLRHTRELLNDSEATNATLIDQSMLLKEEIRRLERNGERLIHFENSEYLKNIILKFLSPERVSGERVQLVPILATMLRLSPDETELLNRVASQDGTVFISGLPSIVVEDVALTVTFDGKIIVPISSPKQGSTHSNVLNINLQQTNLTQGEMNRSLENEESSRQHERLLKRLGTVSHEEQMEELYSFLDPSGHVLEELKRMSSSEGGTGFTSKGPITVSRRDSAANVSDWSDDQCIESLVCDVLESLPEHKQESFNVLMEIMGIDVSEYQGHQKRRYREEMDGAAVNPRQGSPRTPRILGNELDDVAEMPEIIQDDISEAERIVDPNDIGEAVDGDLDVVTAHHDKQIDFLQSHNITVDNPEMGQDITGNQQKIDYRYCSSCKITVKKSIFYQHRHLIRKYGRCDVFTPKIFPCGFSGCHERLGTLEKLCEHMFQVHGVATDIKRELLDSEIQFDDFLSRMKSRGGNFRMPRGSKAVKQGIVQFFRCDGAGPKGITQLIDPLVAETGKKPLVRTEQVCTAFIKKTYRSDGIIEVRYSDHHLHDPEKPRLYERILNRIYDMSEKKLPFPVIVMILQSECNQFCMPGTALERRIMTITPQELQLVAQTAKRGPHTAAKRGGELTEVESKTLEEYERNRIAMTAHFRSLEREAERRRCSI